MKKILIIILFCLINTNLLADKKFEKDLKKLSKVLIYAHEKDPYENTKTLSFLSEVKTVRFIDLSDTKCKKKTMLGGYHGIHLTKCFAESDPKRKEIIKYLDQIF